ncbi:conserved membrane protein, unknown function [Hepatocystis sp. ex Piliocolobus tephrosceles]|nr:conserved membrane protein, unknown function [Hepatocystis sp. ex Piliocolobus tephrosceles]
MVRLFPICYPVKTIVTQYNKRPKLCNFHFKNYCYYYCFHNSKRVYGSTKLIKEEKKKKKMYIEENVEDSRDIYFNNNKLIEKKVACIKIKDSHNKSLFEYLPMEGRTNNVPINFKILHYIFLCTLSTGVLLIHILPEINREYLIRDIFTFNIYCCSSFLVFNGGLNSILQLIQYAIPSNRKYKGLYNTLRYISSLIPLFFGLLSTTLCENFPRDSVLLLILSYLSLLLNYYLLHIKCLMPFWAYKQYKMIISVVLCNLFLLLISEAQVYKGRKISIQVDE